MECRCAHVHELHGEQAAAYAADHLASDPGGGLVCPDTGARWEVTASGGHHDVLRQVGHADTATRDIPPPAA